VKAHNSSKSSHPEIQPESIWDKRYGRALNPDEKKEIERNLSGFFNLLAQWHKELVPPIKRNDAKN
jgi:hypothetical protein